MVRLFVIAIVLSGVIGAFVLWMRRDHAPATVQAPPPQAIDVTVVEVQPQTVSLSPQFLGMTKASQSVEIRVRVEGFILEQSFEEGAPVESGQLLFRIDPRPFEAELAVARARLANAEARLDRAERQVNRYRQAAGSGAVTPTELDEWETEARVGRADVQLAQAQVVQAELDLEYTTIESPITGIIGRALKDVGSYVQAGEQGLLAIVQQVDPIYVEYSVSEQELLRWQRLVNNGEVRVPEPSKLPLSLELADGTKYPHEGHLNFFSIQISPTTGTALARGVLPNPDNSLKPGQFVRVTVNGISRFNTIVVPLVAVMQSPAGAFVYVVNDRGLTEQRNVELGEWLGESWVIQNGLLAGDRVITDRLVMLRPDMPVRITQPPMASSPQPIATSQSAATENTPK